MRDPWSRFLTGLFDDGTVEVLPVVEYPAAPTPGQLELLYRWDEILRTHAVDGLPEMLPESAWWAVRALYRLCQLQAVADPRGTGAIPAWDDPLGRCDTPAAIWSVDLAFRFLPDLLRRCDGLLPTHPVVQRIRRLAAERPFSAVGIPLLPDDPPPDDAAVASLLAHPALAAVYLDRLLEADDLPRLAVPSVRKLARERLGELHLKALEARLPPEPAGSA